MPSERLEPGRAVVGRVDPQRPHRCGRCANPFTTNGGNNQCVNAPAAAERRIIIADFKESPYQELDNGKA